MRARYRSLLLAIACVLTFSWPALAHDETPKPLVTIDINAQGSTMTVAAHVPVFALMDANLPRTDDRALDLSIIAEPLQMVARDLATTLSFMQNGQPLPLPTTSATLSADRSAVDVALGYVIQPGDAPLSARLRTFRSIPDPIAVRATFFASGQSRDFTIAGAPELVVFNPSLTQTLRQFATRGARSAADGWIALLLLVTIAWSIRGAGASSRQLWALLAAEIVGAMVATLIALPPASATAATGIAASIVVVAALVGIVQIGLRWLTPLAAAFGLFNGAALGLAYVGDVSRAGSHPIAGFLALLLTIGLAQAWLLMLFTTARDMAARFGLPLRATALAVLAYACHSALHLLGGDAAAFSTQTAWTVDHLLALLALGWAAVSATAVLAAAGRARSAVV